MSLKTNSVMATMLSLAYLMHKCKDVTRPAFDQHLEARTPGIIATDNETAASLLCLIVPMENSFSFEHRPLSTSPILK
jgi:hypothetical protein